VSDFRLKVIAETQAAESSLKQVDKVATEATRDRNLKIEIPNYSDLSKNFKDLNKDVSSAANGIKDFYKVASKLPVGPINDINQLAGNLKRVAVSATETGRNVGDAGDIIKSTFSATNKAAETLVARLTKIALSLYVIKEAAGLVQGAFGGLFNETIGREIKLRETILKTQTTLASTNKVFRNGTEITDPYQKIVALTGAVRKNIDSIRERSIALAGVTSGEVIEVFGMVASQVGQIGGGLKEAEDLAINFAAALGTFGIPLYQARQEIGSILRGDITTDSYLAKALGIRNEDIAKAKTATGGVVKFLEERLAAAVAGQRIASEGFSGVVSNIKDLSELVSQNFGAGLLDPLLDSLTSVFNFLFSIRNELFEISKLAGKTIGTIADTAIKLIGGATGGARQTRLEGGAVRGRTGGETPLTSKVTSDFGADDALNAAKATVNYVKVEVSKAFSTVYLQISTLLERVSSAFLAVGGGLAMLAKGLLSIKLETFKALIGAVESISPALLVAAKGLGFFLGLWGKFMELPLVQELAQIGIGMRALQATGVTQLIQSGFALKFVFDNFSKALAFVKSQFALLRPIIGSVILYIGQLISNIGRAAIAAATAWAPGSKALQALRTEILLVAEQFESVGNAAQRAGDKTGGFGQNIEKVGGGIVGLIAGMIKFQLIMFAITAILSTAMERFSAYKESQDKIASDKRAQEAVRRLATTYKDLGENATEAQKRAKAFEQSLVNQEYDKAVDGLEKIKKKLEEVRDAFGPKEGFGANPKKGIDNILATFNPANIDILGKQLRGDYAGTDIDSFGEAIERRTLDQRKAAEAEVAKYAKEVDKLAGEDNIKLQAQKRADLSKEIAELERQQQNDLFQQRQSLAQKEVDIFRAAGELRIYQMEQANAKLIEGEQGASRAALEALNTYLSVRENGELDIEAEKKTLAIEVVNLEKTIADYRFENEKKIAEIRKRAGENEMAMADARRQAEGQGPRVAGGGAFDTGLRTGPAPVIGGSADYHQDLSFGPGVDLRQQRELMVQLAQAYDDMGRKIVLSNAGVAGKEFPLKGTAQQQNEFILSAQAAHRNRKGGGRTAIDFYAPTKTDPKGRFGSSVVNQAMLAPTVAGGKTNYFAGGAGGAGLEITKEGASILKLIHGRTDIPLPSGGSIPGVSTAATPQPKLKSLDDIGAPSISKYAESIRNLGSSMERFRALQADLTNARTVSAFGKIAEAAIPTINLEQYRDQLIESNTAMEALAKTSGQAYDPEALQISIDQITRRKIQEEEIAEILKDANDKRNKGLITDKELQQVKDDIAKRQRKNIEDTATEAKLRKQILDSARQQNAIEALRKDTAAIPFELQRAQLQARGSMAQAFFGDDPRQQRNLDAEMRIAERRIQLEQDNTKTNEQVRTELELFATGVRSAATVLGDLDIAVRDFQRNMSLIRDSARTFTEGYKGFFKSILTGGDITEALNSMLSNVADRFLNMALDAAFAPLEKIMEQSFKDLFGVEDPMVAVQTANTTATAANTTATDALTAALQVSAPGASTGGAGAAAAGVVDASGAQASAAEDAASATNAQANATEKSTKAAKDADSGLTKFQKALSGVMGAATGAATIVASIDSMKGGGTYEVLMGLAGIFSGIGSIAGGFAALGKKAVGGPIASNRPYLVGEKGPELIVPQSNGTVIPNNYLIGNNSQLPTPSYVRQTPGSEGATAMASRLEFSYDSTVINNVEYVTADQFQRGMRDSAERGRSLALASLKNSIKARRQVGI